MQHNIVVNGSPAGRSFPWRTRGLAVVSVLAALVAGCGGSEKPKAVTSKPTSSSATPTVDQGAKIEPLLTKALPTDAEVGLLRDKKYEGGNRDTGITAATVFHCRTATPSDRLRVARSARAWNNKAWVATKGKGKSLQMILELVVYRDGGVKTVVDEIAAVPSTCRNLIDESGAQRVNEVPPAGVNKKMGAEASVFSELKYPNGGSIYEVTGAATDDAVLALVTVRGNDPEVVLLGIGAAMVLAIKSLRVSAKDVSATMQT